VAMQIEEAQGRVPDLAQCGERGQMSGVVSYM
jgi:hypothetical protein